MPTFIQLYTTIRCMRMAYGRAWCITYSEDLFGRWCPPGYCFSVAGAPWLFSSSVDDLGAVNNSRYCRDSVHVFIWFCFFCMIGLPPLSMKITTGRRHLGYYYCYCSFMIIFVLSHGGVLSQYRRAYQSTPLALLGLMPSVYETIVLACKGSHLEWFGNGCDLLAPHSPQPPAF